MDFEDGGASSGERTKNAEPHRLRARRPGGRPGVRTGGRRRGAEPEGRAHTDRSREPITSEAQLWWSYRRTGREHFRDRILCLYQAWVVGRAKMFASARGIAWKEIWGAAEIGLIKAIERFDPSCGVPFLAYAARRVDGALVDAARQALGGKWREKRRNDYRERRRMRIEGKSMKTSSSRLGPQAGSSNLGAVSRTLYGSDSPLAPEEALPSREPDPSDAAAEREVVSRILESMEDAEEGVRLREIARRRFTLQESVDEIGVALKLGRSRVNELLRNECLPRARGVMRRLGLAPTRRVRAG